MELDTGQDNKPPNVVLLVLDTARARNLSCYGHERRTTPAIDQLAAEGVRFSRATSVSPWTLPSHASLFTGSPPSVHQTNSLESCLPDSLTTLAQVLSEQGYDTVGMSANPWFSSQFGVTRGFNKFHHLFGPFATDSYREFTQTLTDESESLLSGISTLFSSQSFGELTRNSITAGYRQFVDRDDDGALQAVDYASEVIDQPDPYFLFINFLEPHLPFDPPSDCRRRFMPPDVTDDRLAALNQDASAYNIRNIDMNASDFDLLERLYDAEIYHVDRQIRKILDLIDQTGQRDNTIIFVLGDHGENIGDHGLMAHHYSVNETLLHVPLIVRYPPVIEEGKRVETRVSNLDIPATICSLLGSGTDGRFQSQQTGQSLHNPDPDRSIVAEYLNPVPPISRMQARCENPDFDVSVYDRTFRAVYDGQFKFIQDSYGRRELYDVESDQQEQNNLVEQKPDVTDKLVGELTSWIEEYAEVTEPRSASTDIDEQIEDRLHELGYL